MCFFFQAEDGIRARDVTGVQTCALPICASCDHGERSWRSMREQLSAAEIDDRIRGRAVAVLARLAEAEAAIHGRSEERRVGKECWSMWGSWLCNDRSQATERDALVR